MFKFIIKNVYIFEKKLKFSNYKKWNKKKEREN